MLKLAGVFLFVMIIAGVLGFVVDVAGTLAKIAFFICLIGFAGTVAIKWMGRKIEKRHDGDLTTRPR